MRRGTTPTHEFNIPNEIALGTMEEIYITYWQAGHVVVEKSIEDITVDAENHKLSVTLTQNDTLAFKIGNVEIQVRMKTVANVALASNIISVPAERILKDGVI